VGRESASGGTGRSAPRRPRSPDDGDQDPVGAAQGCGVQGWWSATRVLEDLVPARPDVSRRRTTSTSSWLTGSLTPTPATVRSIRGRPSTLFFLLAAEYLVDGGSTAGRAWVGRATGSDWAASIRATGHVDYSADPRAIGRSSTSRHQAERGDRVCDGRSWPAIARRSWAKHDWLPIRDHGTRAAMRQALVRGPAEQSGSPRYHDDGHAVPCGHCQTTTPSSASNLTHITERE